MDGAGDGLFLEVNRLLNGAAQYQFQEPAASSRSTS